jgi:hypothetical protein
VFKAREADAKAGTPLRALAADACAETSYRPSMLLDRLSASLPETLLVKYRDASPRAIPAHARCSRRPRRGALPPPR